METCRRHHDRAGARISGRNDGSLCAGWQFAGGDQQLGGQNRSGHRGAFEYPGVCRGRWVVRLHVHRRAAHVPCPRWTGTQIGTQYWVVGDAPLTGRVLDLPNVYTGTGTSFGDGLKFSELTIKRWGSVRIEWLSCTRARFSWRSTGANTANFGDGESRNHALLCQ